MNTEDIIKADTIEQYNRFFGFETRHPLVGIVHFDSSVPQPTHRMTLGFYALFLKKTTGCIINYGKTVYDFDDETVVSFAPGQTVGIHRLEDGPAPEAIGLLFHPDFLHRTSLGQKMKQYSFFSYASNEALHLSTEERIILQDYMEKIVRELQHPIDKFSKSLIISNIEVLLNYLYALLRTSVHHPRGYESRCVGAFRAVAGRLPLFGYGGEGRNPDREIFRRQDLPFAQLLRGFGKVGNRKDSARIYPTEDDCRSQRADARPGGNNQTDCRIVGIPASAAFCPLLQTSGRVYTERVQE